MAKAGGRVKITLECQSCKTSALPGVSRYNTTNNNKKTTERLEIKKYCRFERKHTVHREVR
jgi:large subunit ribosomal protein L33